MAAIDQDITAITPTIYGTYLQTVKTLSLPFELIENTTLNERFDVQAGVEPSSSQLPYVGYLAIGNLGHATVKADDGSDETTPVTHRATDAGLYGQIPFVLRETTNDLSSSERRNYGLRVEETHDGTNYFAYYLKRLDLSDIRAQLQRVEVDDNGIVTTTPYEPTTDNLNPERPDISNNGTILGSSTSHSASAVAEIRLSESDVTEILNAHQIRTGSNRSPVISELALVSGVDKEVSGSTGGSGSLTYDEVIAAQVNVFISTYHAVGYSTEGARFTIDIGGTEPHLGEEDENNADLLD